MKKCREVIIYNIIPEKEVEFLTIKEKLIEEAQTINGLISSQTETSIKTKYCYMDMMVWENEEASILGFEVFKTLPSSRMFMSMLSGPPVFQDKFTF
jgi:hypothetical protein